MKFLFFSILFLSFNAQGQIKKQVLLDKGYSIESETSQAITTNPLEIYGATNFHVIVRMIVKVDTVLGQYAISHRTLYTGTFDWTPITNRKQCKLSWPVYRDFLQYWRTHK